MKEKDERRCHLCGGIEVNKYCVNKSCYEYIRYVKSINCFLSKIKMDPIIYFDSISDEEIKKKLIKD